VNVSTPALLLQFLEVRPLDETTYVRHSLSFTAAASDGQVVIAGTARCTTPLTARFRKSRTRRKRRVLIRIDSYSTEVAEHQIVSTTAAPPPVQRTVIKLGLGATRMVDVDPSGAEHRKSPLHDGGSPGE
jgi:hypothetical protein